VELPEQQQALTVRHKNGSERRPTMHDEDSGIKIACTFCGRGIDEPCSHLLAVFDSIDGIVAGYARQRYHVLSDEVLAAFSCLLEAGGSSPKGRDGDIGRLWEQAAEYYQHGDGEVDIDGFIFDETVCDLFVEAGADLFPGADDEESPGRSSAYTVFYAKDPAKTFSRALRELKKRLRPLSAAEIKQNEKRINERIKLEILSATEKERNAQPFNLEEHLVEKRVSLDRSLAGILNKVDVPRVVISGYGAKNYYPERIFIRAIKRLRRIYGYAPIELDQSEHQVRRVYQS
jgi:hypothetical protein